MIQFCSNEHYYFMAVVLIFCQLKWFHWCDLVLEAAVILVHQLYFCRGSFSRPFDLTLAHFWRLISRTRLRPVYQTVL